MYTQPPELLLIWENEYRLSIQNGIVKYARN